MKEILTCIILKCIKKNIKKILPLHSSRWNSNDPGNAQTHDNVDGVTARHVADRVVCIFLQYSRLVGGEQVRQTGAQGDERDGRHRVLQAHQTAKDAGKVIDEGGQYADHHQRHEGQPAAPDGRWRDHGEEHCEKGWDWNNHKHFHKQGFRYNPVQQEFLDSFGA